MVNYAPEEMELAALIRKSETIWWADTVQLANGQLLHLALEDEDENDLVNLEVVNPITIHHQV